MTEPARYVPDGAQLRAFYASNAFLRALVGPVYGGRKTCVVNDIVRRATDRRYSRQGLWRWLVARPTRRGLELYTIPCLKAWLPRGKGEWSPSGRGYALKYRLADGVVRRLEIECLGLDDPADRRRLAAGGASAVWLDDARNLSEAVLEDAIRAAGSEVGGGRLVWSGVVCSSRMPAPGHWLLRRPEDPGDLALFRQPGGRAAEAENLAVLKKRGFAYDELAVERDPDWVRVEIDAEIGFSASDQAREAERHAARSSLARWTGTAMPEIAPARHHQLLIDHLEALERGDIARLMFFLPPGSAKSTYGSVLFPSWYMGRNPAHNVIAASHSKELAERFGRRVRNIAASETFRDTFGFGLSAGSAAAGRFETARGGEYFAVGVDGSVTGRRAHCLPGETLVPTRAGPCRIKDIAIGTATGYVLAWDGARPVYRRVVAIARRRAGELWRIRTAAGNVVEATGDHRIYASGSWRPAAAVAVGDVLLCMVREAEPAASLRSAQEAGGGRLTEAVLQPRMQCSGDERRARTNRTAALSDVRRAVAVAQDSRPDAAFLLAGVQIGAHGGGGREPAHQAGDELRGLRRRNPAHGSGDLQPQMRRDPPRRANERPGEPRIPARPCRPAHFGADIQRGPVGGVAARRRGLRRLQNTWTPGRPAECVERALYSPPQSDALGSPSRKSGDPMPALPRSIARSGEIETIGDPVAVVERVRRDCDVYDIEVEGDHCFFANGVLVHNCGIIDDPIKGRAEADSAAVRQHAWDWYKSDFWTRLVPGAKLLYISTRWHDDDLAGRLLEDAKSGGEQWRVVSVPAIAIEGREDPLGRMPGERLWPEWFTAEMFEQAQRDPRNWSALYQQEPMPETGEYFKSEWLRWYDTAPPREQLRTYGASDYAVSAAAGDFTAHLVVGVDPADDIYLLDLWRERTASDAWAEALIDLMARWKTLTWAEERGQIEKGVGPFLTKRQLERKVYAARRQFTSAHDKATRAQAIRGRMAMGKVLLPRRAPWTTDLVNELLRFPAGRNDDMVDSLSLIGRMLDELIPGSKPRAVEPIRGAERMTWDECIRLTGPGGRFGYPLGGRLSARI